MSPAGFQFQQPLPSPPSSVGGVEGLGLAGSGMALDLNLLGDSFDNLLGMGSRSLGGSLLGMGGQSPMASALLSISAEFREGRLTPMQRDALKDSVLRPSAGASVASSPRFGGGSVMGMVPVARQGASFSFDI